MSPFGASQSFPKYFEKKKKEEEAIFRVVFQNLSHRKERSDDQMLDDL